MALVYSGRPDPEWQVDDALGEELEQVWRSLQPALAGTGDAPPPLGYRGCRLVAPDGRRWTAYRGRVELGSDESSEVRADPETRFESRVLASAAPGLLPPWVLGG